MRLSNYRKQPNKEIVVDRYGGLVELLVARWDRCGEDSGGFSNCVGRSGVLLRRNKNSLRTRRARWTVDGTMARLLQAGEPMIERMRRNYWRLVRNATLDYRNSSLFFGNGIIPRLPHMQRRGRYAGRQRP